MGYASSRALGGGAAIIVTEREGGFTLTGENDGTSLPTWRPHHRQRQYSRRVLQVGRPGLRDMAH